MLPRTANSDLVVGEFVPVPEEHLQIGEELQEIDLAPEDLGVGTEREVDVGLVIGCGARIAGTDVVAEQEVAECEHVGDAAFDGRACLPVHRGRATGARFPDTGEAAATSSSRTSTAPAGTCTLALTSTSRTRPAVAAETMVSSFMLSTTATASPMSTWSPAATHTDTTTPGTGARTMLPSSLTKRWALPSTSTSWCAPAADETTRQSRPGIAIRASYRPVRRKSTSMWASPRRTRYRIGPVRDTSST